jgi:hypothetical protein
MAFLRLAYFPEATSEHFERLTRQISPEVPPGRLVFAAGPVTGGWQVVQLWESRELLEAFNRGVFFPALRRLGDSAFPAPAQVTDFEPTSLSLWDAGQQR